MKRFLHLGSRWRLLKTNVGPANDGANHVVEVVRHAARKSSNRFKPAQLMNLMFEYLVLLAVFRFADLPFDRRNEASQICTGELVHSVQALKCAEEAVRMVLVESGPVVSNKKGFLAIRLESAKLNLSAFSFGCEFPG